MEAKTGRGKHGFSRRKADALSRPAVVRNLIWGNEPSDISLHPQSPLTISKALVTPASQITLLQSPGSSIESDGAAELIDSRREKVTSIHRRKRKPAGTSAGLLTQHSNEELKMRCKRLIVENALVKNKDEKQLYLTVGFLNWVPDPLTEKRYSSALLFYPVRLINEADSEESRFGHVLYNDDGVPHNNEHLREEFQKVTGILLPEFDPRNTLESFLEKIEALLTSESNARLEYHMGLGIAVSPAGINPESIKNPALAMLPRGFSKTLAQNLIANQDVDRLRVTLDLLCASNDYLHRSTPIGKEIPPPDLVQIRQFSVLLSQHGLGNVEFQHLEKLPKQVNKWLASTEPVLNSDLICQTLEQPEITAVNLMKLAGIIELLDKAPDNMQRFLHRDLAFRSTPLLFKRAKHQALMIEEELSQLQQHFHLDRLPAKSQLLHLIEELGGAHNSDIEVVDSHYFNARRQFMDFSTDKPTTLSNEHKRLLNKLVKVLRFRELFVNNTEYRLALGPAYRGLRTKWQELEDVLDFAQEIRQVLGSEEIASAALMDWNGFRTVYTNTLDQLQSANNGLRGLLQIVKPYDHTTTTTEVLRKGRVLSEQLSEWNEKYGVVSNYGEKTANSMLRVFSNSGGLDKGADKQVHRAKDIIRDFMAEQDNAETTVESTLMWLRNAIESETASIQSIRDIIGKAG